METSFPERGSPQSEVGRRELIHTHWRPARLRPTEGLVQREESTVNISPNDYILCWNTLCWTSVGRTGGGRPASASLLRKYRSRGWTVGSSRNGVYIAMIQIRRTQLTIQQKQAVYSLRLHCPPFFGLIVLTNSLCRLWRRQYPPYWVE